MDKLNGLSKEERDLLWNQFDFQVDLYKFFFDWILKLNIFYFTVTGAIVSFYLGHHGESFLKYTLLLPAVMSFFLLVFLLSGRRGLEVAQQEVRVIEELLGLKMKLEIRYLPRFCTVNALLCLIIGLVLAILSFVPLPASDRHMEVNRVVLTGDCEVVTALEKSTNTRPAPDKQRTTRIVCR